VLESNRGAYPAPPGRKSVAARAVLERSVVQVPDVNADPDYALGAMAAAGGYRSAAAVPILRDGLPIGSIAVTRAQAGLLPDRQIDLLKTFADQAVIAIENVRLFTELEARNRSLTESLEQQTATSEILRVISSSPTDTQPVFDAILDNATRLCSARHVILYLYDGATFRTVAFRGLSAEAERLFRGPIGQPGPTTGIGRMLAERRPIQITDVTDDIAYRQGDPLRVRTVQVLGARSAVWLPLLKADAVVGALAIYRHEVRAFSDKQVELVQTFADQAVIAIENVRLFQELQARTRELARSVDELKALGEVGRAVSSTLDLETVLSTIVSQASQLSGTDGCTIYEYDRDAEEFRMRAAHNYDAGFVAASRAVP